MIKTRLIIIIQYSLLLSYIIWSAYTSTLLLSYYM